MNSRYGGQAANSIILWNLVAGPVNITNIFRQSFITIQLTNWRCDFFVLDLTVKRYISQDGFASFPTVQKRRNKLIIYPCFVNLQIKTVAGISHGLSK